LNPKDGTSIKNMLDLLVKIIIDLIETQDVNGIAIVFPRGVYLACVICNEDRILVTAEDTLPILEVDESFSTSTLNSDFHWLMKVRHLFILGDIVPAGQL